MQRLHVCGFWGAKAPFKAGSRIHVGNPKPNPKPESLNPKPCERGCPLGLAGPQMQYEEAPKSGEAY